MSEKKEKDVWMKEELNGCLKIKLENWKKEEFMSKTNLWSKQIKEMIWEGEEELKKWYGKGRRNLEVKGWLKIQNGRKDSRIIKGRN